MARARCWARLPAGGAGGVSPECLLAELWSGAYSRQKAGAVPETNQGGEHAGEPVKEAGVGAPRRRSLRRERLQGCIPGSVARAPRGESRAGGGGGLIARFVLRATKRKRSLSFMALKSFKSSSLISEKLRFLCNKYLNNLRCSSDSGFCCGFFICQTGKV